jgi:hypothetical protein
MTTYHLTYQINDHPDGITQAEVPSDHGACNAILVVSVMYPEAGGVSMLMVDGDGRDLGQDLPAETLFSIWTMLAEKLSDRDDLANVPRAVCKAVMGEVRDYVNNNKTKG